MRASIYKREDGTVFIAQEHVGHTCGRIMAVCASVEDAEQIIKALEGPSPKANSIIRELLTEAEASLEACGTCDHSVGICACELIRRIEDAKAFLKDA